MSSLAELRAIEDERVAAERSALAAAEEARQRDRELAEQRLRDREAQRLLAEREAALAIERVRIEADREARRRIEAAEASERRHQQAALDERRLMAEIDLRRAEVAKKRPTWMVGVTALALVAAVASSAFAVDRHQAASQAAADKQLSERARREARDDARHALDELAQVQSELSTIETRVASALEDVKRAQHAQDLALAAAKLRQIEADDAAMKKHNEDLLRKRRHDEQVKPVIIDEECKHNVMTKKCLK